jgi:hypothetical protein
MHAALGETQALLKEDLGVWERESELPIETRRALAGQQSRETADDGLYV